MPFGAPGGQPVRGSERLRQLAVVPLGQSNDFRGVMVLRAHLFLSTPVPTGFSICRPTGQGRSRKGTGYDLSSWFDRIGIPQEVPPTAPVSHIGADSPSNLSKTLPTN